MLFRSISLVLADNARAEFSFISSFFGRPEDLLHPITSDKMNITWTRSLSNQSHAGGPGDMTRRPSAFDANSSQLSSFHDDDSASVLSDGQGFAATQAHTGRGDRSQRSAVESIWKQVFEPTLEYGKVRSTMCHLLSVSYLMYSPTELHFRHLDAIFARLPIYPEHDPDQRQSDGSAYRCTRQLSHSIDGGLSDQHQATTLAAVPERNGREYR